MGSQPARPGGERTDADRSCPATMITASPWPKLSADSPGAGSVGSVMTTCTRSSTSGLARSKGISPTAGLKAGTTTSRLRPSADDTTWQSAALRQTTVSVAPDSGPAVGSIESALTLAAVPWGRERSTASPSSTAASTSSKTVSDGRETSYWMGPVDRKAMWVCPASSTEVPAPLMTARVGAVTGLVAGSSVATGV